MVIFNKNEKFLLGHRGDPKNFAENTVKSFSSCMGSGALGFETDVHLTSDNQLVISHDAKLSNEIKITESTFEVIRNFSPNIPTLNEVLEIFEGALIDIEIKPIETEVDYEGTLKSISKLNDQSQSTPTIKKITEVLLKTILRFDVQNLLATSFCLDQLVDIKKQADDTFSGRLATGYLFYPKNFTSPEEVLLQTLEAAQVCNKFNFDFFLPHHITMTQEFLEQTEQFDFKMIAWTVNDMTEATRLLEFEQVQGIISDYPNLLQ